MIMLPIGAKSNLDKVDVISAIRDFMEAGINQGYYNQYVDFLALLNAIERNTHNYYVLQRGIQY